MAGGMIIQMPLTNIRAYLDGVLLVDSLLNDETMILQLTDIMNDVKSLNSRPMSIPASSDPNIAALPLYDNSARS